MKEQEQVSRPGLGGGYGRKVYKVGLGYMRRTCQAYHWAICVEHLAQGRAGGGVPRTRV